MKHFLHKAQTYTISLVSQAQSRGLLRIAQIGISLILLGIVFRSTNIVVVLKQLQTIPPIYIFLFLVLMSTATLLTALRWQIILTKTVHRELVVHFFSATMIGLFYNLFLPTSVGGDTVKWLSLPKLQYSKKYIVFSVAVDRAIGILGLVTAGIGSGILGTVLFPHFVSGNVLSSLLILCVLGVLGAAFIFFFSKILRVFHMEKLPKLHQISLFFDERGKQFAFGVLLTVLSQLLFFAAAWSGAVALHLPITFLHMILFGSLIYLFSSLPFSFSGFGTTELGFLYFFMPLGIPKEQILTLTTTLLLFKIVFAVLGWFFGFYHQPFLLAHNTQKM